MGWWLHVQPTVIYHHRMTVVAISIETETETAPCCSACAARDAVLAAAPPLQHTRQAALATEPFASPFPVPEYLPAEWLLEEPTWIHQWRAEHGYGPSTEVLPSGVQIPRLTVTDEGRIGGYFWQQGVCLIDQTATMIPGTHDCWTPEPSPTDYARFHQQDIVLDDGTIMLIGAIGNVGGHASPFASGSAAAGHYANPDAQMIVCRLGDLPNGQGGWLAGGIVPGLTFGDVALLRRCALSGDWRWFAADAMQARAGYDCLGPTLVTRPGLALVRASVRMASVEHPDYLTPDPMFAHVSRLAEVGNPEQVDEVSPVDENGWVIRVA